MFFHVLLEKNVREKGYSFVSGVTSKEQNLDPQKLEKVLLFNRPFARPKNSVKYKIKTYTKTSFEKNFGEKLKLTDFNKSFEEYKKYFK